ncbi:hypothetical protein HDV00_007752 [Rhizophlyctis rosea]|nr:hypothetical protein HDV00_007752 [Rhizophlyctis rosea]
MATVQTLPDILLTLFASPAISVTDLLKCERVSRQWCAIIRNNQSQIWKSKLAVGFPDGCLPVLYGNESWWAWRTLGRRDELLELEVDGEHRELKRADGLLRISPGFVRDLTTAYSPSSYVGVRPTGQFVVSGRGHLHTIFSMFDETAVQTQPIHSITRKPLFIYQQPNLVGRIVPDGVIIFDIWVSGDPTPVSLHPTSRSCIISICGSHVMTTERTGLDGDDEIIKVFYSNSASPIIERYTRFGWSAYAINQSLFACESKDVLTLVRLTDQHQVALFNLPPGTFVSHIFFTRFTLLLDCDEWCWVLDLKLNPLYKMPYRMTVSIGVGKVEARHRHIEDWMLLYQQDDDMLSEEDEGNGVVLVFIYPKVGKYQTIQLPDLGENGYHFTTMEYPTDETGRRTGAGGVLKHYWRRME